MHGSAGGMAYVIRALCVQKKVSLLAWAIIAINIYMLAMIMLNVFYDHSHGHEIATKLYLPHIAGLAGFSALLFGIYWIVKRNKNT